MVPIKKSIGFKSCYSLYLYGFILISSSVKLILYLWIFHQVFLKAMAETGQVKLYGEIPTLTETALFRARRHIFKEERYSWFLVQTDCFIMLLAYYIWLASLMIPNLEFWTVRRTTNSSIMLVWYINWYIICIYMYTIFYFDIYEILPPSHIYSTILTLVLN